MGFLDNSTNNIIVDAVLTDVGRAKLSRGEFRPVYFAFGDDEVDYSLIKKFGRTVGKQKIELNTPVFEAQTNNKFGLKYRLVSFTDATLGFIPGFSIAGVGAGATANLVVVTNSPNPAQQQQSFIVEQTNNGSANQPETIENNVIVTLNSRFISLRGATPSSQDEDGFVQYIVNTPGMAQDGAQFTIVAKALTQQDFDFYGSVRAAGQGLIETLVTVVGVSTGARVDVKVSIMQAATS